MVDFSKLLEIDDEAALRNYAARLPVTELAIDPQTGFEYKKEIVPALKLPVQGQHEYTVPGIGEVRPFQWFPSVAQGIENVKAISEEGAADWDTVKDRLFGSKKGKTVNTLAGKVKVEPDATFVERFQTWPEKMVRSGVSLPFDVMANPGMLSDTPISDIPGAPSPYQHTIERAQDLAGLAAGGSVVSAGATKPKAGTLAARLTEAIEVPAVKFAEDAEAGSAIAASKNSLANRLNEHLNERNTGMNETMPEILQRQRASEGYEAAIRDPETKKLYTGMWHEEVLDKIAKDKGIPKDQLPTNLRKGYVDYDGKFWTEQQLENKSKSRTAMFRADDIVGTGLAAVAPRFYSHVENLIDGATTVSRNAEGKRIEVPQQKFNSNELMNFLKNKGATVEELEALRLPEFLQGKKSVTRDELQQYLKDNKVELNERWSGENPQIKELIELEQKRRELNTKIYETMDSSKENALIAELDKVEEKIKAIPPNPNFKPRFAQYQLPGGENYRELLMSVKDNPGKVKRIEEINNEISEIRKQMPDDINDPKTKQLYNRQNELAKERLELEHSFTTEHWPGNKDIVVHSRMNDRFIPDEKGPIRKGNVSIRKSLENDGEFDVVNDKGRTIYTTTDEMDARKYINDTNQIKNQKEILREDTRGYKTLHAEEVQSDWLQQGNSEGFKLSSKEKAKLEPEFNRIEEKIINSGDEQVMSNPEIKDAIKLAVDKKIITADEAKTYLRYADSERFNAVKDAPFKGTWSDLMVKRLIREAAEGGYDAVSWTPGQAQADRYNLRHQVDKIEYMKNDDGTYELEIKGKDGKNIPMGEKYYTKDTLKNLVGKEMADKIIKDEGKKSGNKAVLEGGDLEVGGEFHKKFYDEILVNKVNAIAKKFGGRVEEKHIETKQHISKPTGLFEETKRQPIWVLKLTPEMKKHALEKGFSMFETGLPLPSSSGNEQQKYRLIPVPHNPFVQQ